MTHTFEKILNAIIADCDSFCATVGSPLHVFSHVTQEDYYLFALKLNRHVDSIDSVLNKISARICEAEDDLDAQRTFALSQDFERFIEIRRLLEELLAQEEAAIKGGKNGESTDAIVNNVRIFARKLFLYSEKRFE